MLQQITRNQKTQHTKQLKPIYTFANTTTTEKEYSYPENQSPKILFKKIKHDVNAIENANLNMRERERERQNSRKTYRF